MHPGVYKAHVKVESRRKGCIFGWKLVSDGFTNSFTVGTTPAQPNFNVNGFPIPANGSAINVCGSNIKLNAAATTCEKNYFIGVEEAGPSWNRTYKYEWGRWFSGQAPNLMNLQGLSATYSTGTSFLGTDLSRQGDILFGGNLPSGEPRHYIVKVCTADPTWQCKHALIKVNSNCKIDPLTIEADPNEYLLLEGVEVVAVIDDSNIESSFESEVVEQEDPFEGLETATINISPNPFSSSTSVRIDNYEGEAPILFELYNALGERVQSLQTMDNQFDLQRNKLSAGIYMYRATVEDQLLGSGKVVIE